MAIKTGPYERFKRRYFVHVDPRRKISERRLLALYHEMVRRQSQNYRSKRRSGQTGIGITGKPYTQRKLADLFRESNPTLTKAEAARFARRYETYKQHRRQFSITASMAKKNLLTADFMDAGMKALRNADLERTVFFDPNAFDILTKLPRPLFKLLEGFDLLPTQSEGRKKIVEHARWGFSENIDGQDLLYALGSSLYKKILRDIIKNGRKNLARLQKHETKNFGLKMADWYNRIYNHFRRSKKRFKKEGVNWGQAQFEETIEDFTNRLYSRFGHESIETNYSVKLAADYLSFPDHVKQFKRFNRENALFSEESRRYFAEVLQRGKALSKGKIKTPKNYADFLRRQIKLHQDHIQYGERTDPFEDNRPDLNYNPEKAFKFSEQMRKGFAQSTELIGYFGFLINMMYLLREEPGLFRHEKK